MDLAEMSGKRLLLTDGVAFPDSVLYDVDYDTGDVLRTVTLPSTPYAIALSQNNEACVVCWLINVHSPFMPAPCHWNENRRVCARSKLARPAKHGIRRLDVWARILF